MADELNMFYQRKAIPNVKLKSQVSEIADKIMNFTTINLQQFSMA